MTLSNLDTEDDDEEDDDLLGDEQDDLLTEEVGAEAPSSEAGPSDSTSDDSNEAEEESEADESPDDARIEEALARFTGRGLPMLWSVTPSARPQDLGIYLEAHGFTNAGTMTGMAVDLGALNEDGQPPAGFVIERATDLQRLEQWRHAYVHGFDLAEEFGRAFFDLYAGVGFDDRAPLRHYVGLLDGEPVAASTLHLGVAAAGLWHVGTAPAARRRGIGRAMSLAPLRDARALGYRIATIYSAASGMGRNIYRRLGFQEYFGMTQYSYTAAR